MIHKIDPTELFLAVNESMFGMTDTGFCTSCGMQQFEVEPDARRYECDDCGHKSVYGAVELVIMGYPVNDPDQDPDTATWDIIDKVKDLTSF
tara:strand:- start:94 stop:369 length:276 start_codon:yes stop_codon:yes gene_type:complete